MSQTEFCKGHDLAYAAFHYYYKEFRDRMPVVLPAPKFVPLQVTHAEAGIFASIDFGSGNSLKIYQAVDPHYLKQLLS